VTDRDRGRDDRGEERGGDTCLGRDEPVQAGCREQRQRHDGQADGEQDVTDDATQAEERELAQGDRQRATGEPDQHAHRLGDPAAAEREAEEEACPQDERDAADDGEHPALEPRLDGRARHALAVVDRGEADALQESARGARAGGRGGAA
jgi:hypothetical protein